MKEQDVKVNKWSKTEIYITSKVHNTENRKYSEQFHKCVNNSYTCYEKSGKKIKAKQRYEQWPIFDLRTFSSFSKWPEFCFA